MAGDQISKIKREEQWQPVDPLLLIKSCVIFQYTYIGHCCYDFLCIYRVLFNLNN